MGVDLKLVVLEPGDLDPSSSRAIGNTILALERRQELWDRVLDLKSRPVGAGRLRGYLARSADPDEPVPRYGTMEVDDFGDELRWVWEGELAACLAAFNLGEGAEAPYANVAAAAYLKALRLDTPVVLFWH